MNHIEDAVIVQLQAVLARLEAMEVLPAVGSPQDKAVPWETRFKEVQAMRDQAVAVALLTIPPEVETVYHAITKRYSAILRGEKG